MQFPTQVASLAAARITITSLLLEVWPVPRPVGTIRQVSWVGEAVMISQKLLPTLTA
jgi:hypothetical protein